MKIAFLSFISYLISVNLHAQNKSDLYGRWRFDYNGNDPSAFTLLKPQNEELEYRWGRFIEFNEDGTYDESASAPCGLDDNRYHYRGIWNYDPKTNTIELTQIKVLNNRPNIYSKYKVLSSGKIQILDLKKDKVTIKITKPWEKISPKE